MARVNITESQIKRIIAESTRKVLREASIGRGTNTDMDSSYSGDEYGGMTTHSYQTSENPYDSDGALMLANRLEKRLGNGYSVKSYPNKEKNSKAVEFIINGNDLGLEYNFDGVLYVMNTAKQLFGDSTTDVFLNDNGTIGIRIDASNLLKNEPRRGMLPKNSKNPSITGSNFDHPRYWNEYEN